MPTDAHGSPTAGHLSLPATLGRPLAWMLVAALGPLIAPVRLESAAESAGADPVVAALLATLCGGLIVATVAPRTASSLVSTAKRRAAIRAQRVAAAQDQLEDVRRRIDRVAAEAAFGQLDDLPSTQADDDDATSARRRVREAERQMRDASERARALFATRAVGRYLLALSAGMTIHPIVIAVVAGRVTAAGVLVLPLALTMMVIALRASRRLGMASRPEPAGRGFYRPLSPLLVLLLLPPLAVYVANAPRDFRGVLSAYAAMLSAVAVVLGLAPLLRSGTARQLERRHEHRWLTWQQRSFAWWRRQLQRVTRVAVSSTLALVTVAVASGSAEPSVFAVATTCATVLGAFAVFLAVAGPQGKVAPAPMLRAADAFSAFDRVPGGSGTLATLAAALAIVLLAASRLG